MLYILIIYNYLREFLTCSLTSEINVIIIIIPNIITMTGNMI